MEICRSEIYRYLGFGKNEPDEQMKKMTEDCLAELEKKAVPRFFGRLFPLTLSGGRHVEIGGLTVESRDLYRNLESCRQAYLFAATLGAGPDQLIAKYSRLSVSKAVVMQAAAAAMIEAWCDEKNEELRVQCGADGFVLRPRFSPGYGDFPLECQRRLLDMLEAGKRVGITLTEGYLMAPSKSVTAVIGLCRRGTEGVSRDTERPEAGRAKCGACEKTDCVYRRGQR